MTAFWLLSGLAAALAAWILLTFARRGEREAPADAPATLELDELERLRSRGLMTDDAFAAARAEAARRLIRERDEQAPPVARPEDRRWILVAAVVSAAVALGLYLAVAAPGFGDQPYERRVDQWAETPEMLDAPQLAAVMARAAAERPEDAQAQAMLGAARFAAGDPLGSASAFRRVVTLEPENAQAWARLGESLVRASQGTIGADAEAAFREAVRLDPEQGGARFFLGELALQRGQAQEARAMWGPLIETLDPADPRRADLIARLEAAS